MSAELNELYNKYAPRWFKVIRWREWAERTVQRQKLYLFILYVPLALAWKEYNHPYPRYLFLYRPQTEQERMELKRDTNKNLYVKNWKIDQYNDDMPPMYDTWERRKKYPQYYGDKYNTFKKDDAA